MSFHDNLIGSQPMPKMGSTQAIMIGFAITLHPPKGHIMIQGYQKEKPSFAEFVIILSLMMSLTALSIDAMLPALPQIGSDLGVQNANSHQLVISVLFLGLALGQLFFGPLSDHSGRKPAIYIGYAIYIGGALLSLFSVSFQIMLAGMLLQGFGMSATRALPACFCGDCLLARFGVAGECAPGDAFWYAFPDSLVAHRHRWAFHPCAGCRRSLRRAAASLVFHGVPDADLLLCWCAVWQPEFRSHAALRTPGRHWRGGGGFAFDPDPNAAGYADRSELRRHGAALDPRHRHAFRPVHLCRPLGGDKTTDELMSPI